MFRFSRLATRIRNIVDFHRNSGLRRAVGAGLLIETSGKVLFGERTYKQTRNVGEEENFEFEIENRVDVSVRNGLSCLI